MAKAGAAAGKSPILDVEHLSMRFGGLVASDGITLDVGARDDLHVIRFNAKERDAQRTFRWTQDVSYVSVTTMPTDARELTIWMANGGRPETLPPL